MTRVCACVPFSCARPPTATAFCHLSFAHPLLPSPLAPYSLPSPPSLFIPLITPDPPSAVATHCGRHSRCHRRSCRISSLFPYISAASQTTLHIAYAVHHILQIRRIIRFDLHYIRQNILRLRCWKFITYFAKQISVLSLLEEMNFFSTFLGLLIGRDTVDIICMESGKSK